MTCPQCNSKRKVKVWKKEWGTIYIKLCKKCCQLGKKDSEETKEKKKQALKGVSKPIEYSIRLKQKHIDDPALRLNLIPGAGAGHNKGKKNKS